jgi:hypothetical protein
LHISTGTAQRPKGGRAGRIETGGIETSGPGGEAGGPGRETGC